MAAFKKFLKGTKNKMKPSSKMKKQGGEEDGEIDDEEFRKRKQQWQEDMEQMSEFLVLKSTEEQLEEGVQEPVDTAILADRDGLPVLKLTFDLKYFKPEDVNVKVNGDEFMLIAQSTDDSRQCSLFRKTMIRKLNLPKHVETRSAKCLLSKQNILTIELPFHFPAQRRPRGFGVVPIEKDKNGKKKIKLSVPIGKEFVSDEISVDLSEGHKLRIKACYDEEVGHYGYEITKRSIDKLFKLPEKLIGKIDAIDYYLDDDGILQVEIILKNERDYTYSVTTEEVVNNEKGEEEGEEEEEDEEGDEDVFKASNE